MKQKKLSNTLKGKFQRADVGKIKGLIGGFASDLPIETILNRYGELRQSAACRGASMRDIFSTVAALTAAVILRLRICESGLIDIKTGNWWI